jgi:hypothetical protein
MKKPPVFTGGFSNSSLTMSYFHTGTRTIIGAEAFHCPVRDGKEWDHLAMVIRLNRSLQRFISAAVNSQSLNQIFDCIPVIDEDRHNGFYSL